MYTLSLVGIMFLLSSKRLDKSEGKDTIDFASSFLILIASLTITILFNNSFSRKRELRYSIVS